MAGQQVRQPAVAGMFYEAGRAALLKQIRDCYLDRRGPGAVPVVNENGPRRIVGLVCPHAGYIYSGPTVAKAMAALAADGRPDCFVIIGPNHGRGVYASAIQTEGVWRTPLGDSPIASELAKRIADLCPELRRGADLFVGEHSLEVELPFIQHLYGTEAPIVPIMMLDQSWGAAQSLGLALAEALAEKDAVMVASTDMTHYEPPHVAERQDAVLIERMEALDPEGLLRKRAELGVSMCGYGPVAAMLVAARRLGATEARRLDYTNSGAVGPRSEVVAYLALEVRRTA